MGYKQWYWLLYLALLCVGCSAGRQIEIPAYHDRLDLYLRLGSKAYLNEPEF